MFTSRVWILFWLFVSTFAHSRDKLTQVTMLQTLPTQSTVGMEEVRIRQKLIEAARAKSAEAFYELLRENPGTAIRGPNGQLYLVDGHHFARALIEAGVDGMYVEVTKDWSDKTPDEFWNKMIAKEKVYLKKFGQEIASPDKLPKRIVDLEDDPYRSLAWLLKKKGSFENLDMPFQEFLYADYLRERVVIDFSSPEAVEATVQAAEKVLRGADHLPGYIKGKGRGGVSKCDLDAIFKGFGS